jgi:3D-(3,5/4)-trihydroxycyclohexane-1,2-dione acylhydrolase (decyclizing)
VGVTGSEPGNRWASQADLVVALGTRLTDFTTGSRRLFPDAALVSINVDPHDAHKHGALPVVGDVGRAVTALAPRSSRRTGAWSEAAAAAADAWVKSLALPNAGEAWGDGEVVTAVRQWADASTTVVAASGGLPGELHKRWRSQDPEDYHVEYGFSCMGYELAGGLGVKLARPDRHVVVLVGDGAYLMLNSELQTACELGLDLTVVVVDNGGFGCIHRLQTAVGGRPYNNLRRRRIDFVGHARALGAHATPSEPSRFEADLDRARREGGVQVVVIDVDPDRSTPSGGAPWTVPAAPERP